MVRVYLAEIPEEEAKTPAEAHARQSAAARRLLALALRRDYPEAAKALPIEKDEKGRPYLATRLPLWAAGRWAWTWSGGGSR